MGTRWVKSIRYFLPIYPFMALFAAWAVVELWKRGSARLGTQGTEGTRGTQGLESYDAALVPPQPAPSPLSPPPSRSQLLRSPSPQFYRWAAIIAGRASSPRKLAVSTAMMMVRPVSALNTGSSDGRGTPTSVRVGRLSTVIAVAS